MATNNRGGNRSNSQGNRESNNRGSSSSSSSSSGNRGRSSSRNNNPEGRNQYSGGWIGTAKERPFTAAATIGGAVAAGVFLWSRRNQISDQISDLSDQLSEWREGIGSDSESDIGRDSFMARSNRGGRKSQSEIAEEALTLKETGKKSKRGGDATIDQQTQVGAVAY